MRRPPHPHSLAGFTLIEVMVALLVVALGMTAVIQAVSDTASNSSYIRDKTVAHWIAMNKLTEVRLLPTAPKIAKSSDDIEMAGRDWRWTMEVQATPLDTMRRIDISVRPKEASEKSSMASVTGFYSTAIAAPGTVPPVDWSNLGGGGPLKPGTDDNNDENNNDNGGHPPPTTPPNEDPDDPHEPLVPDPSEEPHTPGL